MGFDCINSCPLSSYLFHEISSTVIIKAVNSTSSYMDLDNLLVIENHLPITW